MRQSSAYVRVHARECVCVCGCVTVCVLVTIFNYGMSPCIQACVCFMLDSGA